MHLEIGDDALDEESDGSEEEDEVYPAIQTEQESDLQISGQMSQRNFKSERSFEIVVKKNEPAKNKE